QIAVLSIVAKDAFRRDLTHRTLQRAHSLDHQPALFVVVSRLWRSLLGSDHQFVAVLAVNAFHTRGFSLGIVVAPVDVAVHLGIPQALSLLVALLEARALHRRERPRHLAVASLLNFAHAFDRHFHIGEARLGAVCRHLGFDLHRAEIHVAAADLGPNLL